MTPVHQTPGAARGQNGDCFTACVASAFDLPLAAVPNFFQRIENGQPIPPAESKAFNAWLMQNQRCRYLEFGFRLTLTSLLLLMGTECRGILWLLTGCTRHNSVHTVVARGGKILHDPGGMAVGTYLTRPCPDGVYRVGFFALEL